MTTIPGATGQAQKQAVGNPLQHEVSVVLKLIHVYVTDKKGNPVPDLTIGDFTVTDEGQPVTLTDFEKHALAAAAAPEAKKEAVDKPEIRPELIATPVPTARLSARKFFLFFDLAFNNLRGVAKAKKAAFHFLDTQVEPNDEVGVITYSTFGGIKVHEFLTEDHAKIRDAVEALSRKVSLGRAEEIEDRYWRLIQEWSEPDPKQSLSEVPKETKPPSRIIEARAQRSEAKRLTQEFIQSLTALAKSLRYVPDQKQFIMFSSGVPNSVIYGGQIGNPNYTRLGAGGSAVDLGDSTLRNLNEAMYREFAVSGCTFYSFDTRESAKGADLFGWDIRRLEGEGGASPARKASSRIRRVSSRTTRSPGATSSSDSRT